MRIKLKKLESSGVTVTLTEDELVIAGTRPLHINVVAALEGLREQVIRHMTIGEDEAVQLEEDFTCTLCDASVLNAVKDAARPDSVMSLFMRKPSTVKKPG